MGVSVTPASLLTSTERDVATLAGLELMSNAESVPAALRLLDDAVPNGALEYALAAVDRGHVVLLKGPSGRSVHVVVSSLHSKKQVPGVDLAASGISTDGTYTCVGAYCSCAEHRLGIEGAERRRFCKHLLAVQIAMSTGKYTTRRVTDAEVARVLES
jgi:predicted nucleic acid-binding Zn finger protein